MLCQTFLGDDRFIRAHKQIRLNNCPCGRSRRARWHCWLCQHYWFLCHGRFHLTGRFNTGWNCPSHVVGKFNFNTRCFCRCFTCFSHCRLWRQLYCWSSRGPCQWSSCCSIRCRCRWRRRPRTGINRAVGHCEIVKRQFWAAFCINQKLEPRATGVKTAETTFCIHYVPGQNPPSIVSIVH